MKLRMTLGKYSATLAISKNNRRRGFDKQEATISDMASAIRQKERFEAFVEFSENVDEKLRRLHLGMTERVFNEIIEYIGEVDSLLEAERMLEENVRLLPVICFNTGINLADHKSTFEILGGKIEETFEHCRVCRLSANKLSTLKSTFTNMCNQLGVSFSVDATISTIEQHFASEDPPLIALILENCESIDIRIFSKFLEIVANSQSALKIIVILGIATDTEMIKDLIPYEALSLCDIRQFRCLAATHYLQEFLDEEIMHPDSYFQLSGRCFEWSLIEFLSHDFSVSNYAAKVKFAALTHYANYACSFACQPREKALQAAKTVGKRELACINGLPSVKTSRKESISSAAELVVALEEYFEDERKTRILLKCLLLIQSFMIEAVFGARSRQVYMRSLCEALYKTNEYRKFITYYGVLDKHSFISSINKLSELLEESGEFETLKSAVQHAKERLESEDIDKLIEEPDLKEPETKRAKRAPKNAFELQKQLKSMTLQKQGPKSVFQEIRKEFCEKFDKVAQEFLMIARQDKPLAEIFFFYKQKMIDVKMVPPMVDNIERSLKNPFLYTKDEKMALTNADCTNENLPPVCVAFKLFTQMGSMVNVADWLDSCTCILENRKQKNKIKKEDMEATFFQSVSDLQFLGLLKPTQRKTDHVQKVTWAL